MSYIEQFEQELLKKLQGAEDTAAIVRWVSEKVLESYRNGITAGQKGGQVIRKGQSRRRGFPAQALQSRACIISHHTKHGPRQQRPRTNREHYLQER